MTLLILSQVLVNGRPAADIMTNHLKFIYFFLTNILT